MAEIEPEMRRSAVRLVSQRYGYVARPAHVTCFGDPIKYRIELDLGGGAKRTATVCNNQIIAEQGPLSPPDKVTFEEAKQVAMSALSQLLPAGADVEVMGARRDLVLRDRVERCLSGLPAAAAAMCYMAVKARSLAAPRRNMGLERAAYYGYSRAAGFRNTPMPTIGMREAGIRHTAVGNDKASNQVDVMMREHGYVVRPLAYAMVRFLRCGGPSRVQERIIWTRGYVDGRRPCVESLSDVDFEQEMAGWYTLRDAADRQIADAEAMLAAAAARAAATVKTRGQKQKKKATHVRKNGR